MSKVALVTGGAVRVGRAITLGLAETGFDVVVHYNSSEGPALEVVRQVEALGRRAIAVGGTLADAETPTRIAEEVGGVFGRLDVLVNSAATFLAAPLLEVDADEWDRIMAVNLRAPFLLARATAELLRASEGCIINMVDLSAFHPFDHFPHHSVSKAGLLQLTRAMAVHLAPEVRVNAIAPGLVLAPDGMGEARRREEIDRIPLARSGTPEDVVRTVLYLVGSHFVTGEVIVVDGGQRVAGGRQPG